MATATLDPIKDEISATTKNGRVERVVRTAQITNIAATDGVAVIAEMLSATGLPADGALITINGTVLQVVGRDPTRSSGDKTSGKVRITYERVGTPTSDLIRKSGRTSVRQVRTELDAAGTQITVTHEGVTQGGEIEVFLPQLEPVYETIERTDDPEGLAQTWTGRVNSDTFLGKDPGTWLITEASYQELDVNASPQEWKFRWAMQQSEDDNGWLPVVAYIDPDTGRPAPNLVADQGIKAVPYYETIAFGSKFTF